MSRTTSASRAQIRLAWPALVQCMAKAVPHAPPPITPIWTFSVVDTALVEPLLCCWLMLCRSARKVPQPAGALRYDGRC